MLSLILCPPTVHGDVIGMNKNDMVHYTLILELR